MDQSAAFETLSHDILLDKLNLYGIGPNALKWIENFLRGRTQYVKIGATSSNWRTMTCGVPQGSVLGPILYAVYVNDITLAVIDQECSNPVHENREELFGQHCNDCGEVITYADDSTYHTASKKRTDNQSKIDKNILKLQKYMNNNELFLNMGKTTVLELMIKQKRGRTQGTPPMITPVPGQWSGN